MKNVSLKSKIEKSLTKTNKTDLKFGKKMLSSSIKGSLQKELGISEGENFSYEGFNFGWYMNVMGIEGYNILYVKF